MKNAQTKTMHVVQYSCQLSTYNKVPFNVRAGTWQNSQ